LTFTPEQLILFFNSFLSEVILIIGFFFIIIVDLLLDFFNSEWGPRKRLQIQLNISLSYLFFFIIYLIKNLNIETSFISGFFYQAPATNFLKILLTGITIFWLVLLKEIYRRKKPVFSLYPSLIFIFLFINFCIIINLNLFCIFVCLEIQNILIFALLSLNIRDVINYKQVLHYFLLSSLISGFMAMGCALIYVSCGTLDIGYLYECLYYLKNSFYFLTGSFLILIGFLFKLGLFPFFFWIPAIFRTAPISGLFATTILAKSVYFYILFSSLNFLVLFYSYIIIIVSLLSILICTFLAIRENMIRGVLGYSSVIQTGFLTLVLPFPSLKLNAVIINYLIIYCITMAFIFFFLMILEDRKKDAKIIFIHDLKSIGTINFYFASCFIMAIFSLAGLPPFPGFLGKLFLIIDLWKTGNYLIAIFIIIYTLITMFYYIKFINLMFSGTPASIPEAKNGELNFTNMRVLIIVIFVTWNFWFLFTGCHIIYVGSLFLATFISL